MHHNPKRPGPPPSADEGVVLYEKRDRIAYVTINRPEAKNAVSPEVHRSMIAAWADFADNDSVDVAILTGTGDSFCAGVHNSCPAVRNQGPRHMVVTW
jgi:enoyl-CoA hydratase/carnithine racemase